MLDHPGNARNGDRGAFGPSQYAKSSYVHRRGKTRRRVLQQRLELTEPEAFRWIQKTAMDLRLSMRQVAEGVVRHGPEIAAQGSGSPEE